MRISAIANSLVMPPVRPVQPVKAVQPDEPKALVAYHGHGMIERAPESQSISHVTAHERAHINSYRTRAFQEGSEVVSEDVAIRYEMRDGVLVAVAGEASATLRRRDDTAGDDAKLQSTPAGPGPTEVQGHEAPADPDAASSAVRELEAAEVRASADLRAAEAALSRLPASADTPEGHEAARRLEARRTDAEGRLREAQMARQTMLLARFLAETSSLVRSAARAQTEVAARIAYATTGVQP